MHDPAKIDHVGPEEAVGGRIGLLRDGDVIAIDAEAGTLYVEVAPDELDQRRQAWRAHPTRYTSGTLWKYAQTVGPAHLGALSHPGPRRRSRTTRSCEVSARH